MAIAEGGFREIILGSLDARLTNLKGYYSELSRLSEKVPLRRELYPLFVTFDDLDDPATVKWVDPDDLEASFGEGYSLKSVTLEITDEEITKGSVQKIFDYFWWPEEKRHEYSCKVYRCGRNPIRVELPNNTIDALTILDFQRD